MLRKFLRFSRMFFLPLTIIFFLSLVVGAGNWYLHFYHGNATFNIKLILRIIRYPHNDMCFLKVSYDSVNYLLILSVAMVRLWIF